MKQARAMRRVAVFGNAGAGKSTLARRLAELTGLPLYPLDIVQFRGCYRPDEKDGGKLTNEEIDRLVYGTRGPRLDGLHH